VGSRKSNFIVRHNRITGAYDGMRRTDGRRKDRNINEKDRQAQGMIKRRWRSKQSKRVAYTKQIRRSCVLIIRRRGKSDPSYLKNLKGGYWNQRRIMRMAGNQERGEGRWTRSRETACEGKGKKVLEESPPKKVVTIQGDPEEDLEFGIYIIEEEDPEFKAEQKGTRSKKQEGSEGIQTDKDTDQDDEEEWKQGRGIRGRGT